MLQLLLTNPLATAAAALMLVCGVIWLTRYRTFKNALLLAAAVTAIAVALYQVNGRMRRRLATRALDSVTQRVLPAVEDALIRKDSDACEKIMRSNPRICGMSLLQNDATSCIGFHGLPGSAWDEEIQASKNAPVDACLTFEGQRFYWRIGCIRNNHGEILGYFILGVAQD